VNHNDDQPSTIDIVGTTAVIIGLLALLWAVPA